MMGKRIWVYSLPIVLFTQACIAGEKVIFDFHDHDQKESSFEQWSESESGIKLVVKGSDDLFQNSNGIGVDDDELDAKNGHDETLQFNFLDEKSLKPVNVVIKSLRLKLFEPKMAQDSAQIIDLSGRQIAMLNSGLYYQGSAGFGKDRHSSNTWSLADVEVMSGFTISPDSNSGFYVYSLEVEAMDMPAEFTSPPIIEVAEGTQYQYKVELADENVSAVVLTLEQGPEGMVLDQTTSTLTWLPSFETQGQYPVKIRANDSEGQLSYQAFTLDVKNANQAPEFISTPLLEGKENALYQYALQTEDKDLDTLFVKLVSAPKGMKLDKEKNTLLWTPNFNDAGKHIVTVSVSDVYDEIQQQFEVDVADTNRLPSITSDAPDESKEGKTFQYAVKASDPDLDTLSYELLIAPKGMSIIAETGVIQWTPNYHQSGSHYIAVQVNDGKQGSFIQRFELATDNINRTPKIISSALAVATENSPYLYHILATDEDLDGITMSLEDGPSGMKLDAATKSIYWIPSYDDAGSYKVTIAVSDEQSEQEKSFKLTVNNLNRAPVLAEISNRSLQEGELFEHQLNADEFDKGDNLRFELEQAPKGMKIEKESGEITWPVGYDQAGEHLIAVKAYDDQDSSHEQQFTLKVKNVNLKPIISSKPFLVGIEDQHYFYNIHAHDRDDDAVSYKLLSGPKGMTVESNNGYVNWKPDFTQAGTHQVTLAVSDGFTEINQVYEIDVKNQNREPRIVSTAKLDGAENVQYRYPLKATDEDGNKLTFSLLTAPQGMQLDTTNNELTWIPDWHQAGFHQVIVQVADSEGGLDKQVFKLAVKNNNRGPKFSSEAITTATETQQYQYTLAATDEDNDRLKYTLILAPKGMQFDPYTHTLSWLPGYRSAGKHEVKVSVSDGKKVAKQSFIIQVKNKNRQPKINSVGSTVLNEGEVYEYSVLASDADTDELVYSLLQSPQKMEINAKTGLIKWQSDFNDAGQQGIEILVEDGKGGQAIQAFRLLVTNKNRAPEFVSQPETQGQLLTPYRYQIISQDADWDVLKHRLVSGPKEMKLDADDNTVYWSAENVKSGDHQIILEIDDGSVKVKQSFTLQVPARKNIANY